MDGPRGPRALGIVLLRHRLAEQRHQPVAEISWRLAAHFHYRGRSRVEIAPTK